MQVLFFLCSCFTECLDLYFTELLISVNAAVDALIGHFVPAADQFEKVGVLMRRTASVFAD